jgi:hypothetical protein
VRGPNQTRREKMSRSRALGKAREIALGVASSQATRVPWQRFRRAHEEYVQWEAFVLWAKAIVDAEGCAIPLVLSALKKRCASFVKQSAHWHPPELLALRLHEWIHDRVFAYAKQEGWLDALHFYGVRDPRCEGAWAHWEQCEQEWTRDKQKVYPAFSTWWRAAQDHELFQQVSARRLVGIVKVYVDWMAFVQWLRPFLSRDVKLPGQVARQLRRKCPHLVESTFQNGLTAKNLQSVTKSIEERFFLDVKEEGWLDCVRQRASTHPRHVRTIAYSEFWMKHLSRNPSLTYPPFSRWRYMADNFGKESQ